MEYVDRAAGSELWPKLLGTYEKEIAADVVELAAQADGVVVVGAAEGYYVAGLAKRFPQTRVVAFESSVDARSILRELVRKNNVEDRISVFGQCDLDTLQEALVRFKYPLLLMDIDGGEVELVDPIAVPQLNVCSAIIETHDYLRAETSRELVSRLERTHRILVRRQRVRSLRDLPFEPSLLQRALGAFALRHLLDEHRPAPQEWLIITPQTDREARE